MSDDKRLQVYPVNLNGGKMHAQASPGESACGRKLVAWEGAPLAQDVAQSRWCEAPACREIFASVARWPYRDDACGCRRYVGDLDAPHISERCEDHPEGTEEE